MTKITEISENNYKTALKIINELEIESIWQSYNSRANLVGSIKTGLLMSHLDIDYHIYSDDFSIKNSFAAVAEIAGHPGVNRVLYINNIEQEDMCLEWHLKYTDNDNRIWQIDLIHIMNDSPYTGKFERVADKINRVLTEKTREAILKIKWELSENDQKAMGIEVCKAVIEDNISTYSEFLDWKKINRNEGILQWEPEIDNYKN